jgi:hypothetical protein
LASFYGSLVCSILNGFRVIVNKEVRASGGPPNDYHFYFGLTLVDLAKLISSKGVFEPLKDAAYFSTVKKSMWDRPPDF